MIEVEDTPKTKTFKSVNALGAGLKHLKVIDVKSGRSYIGDLRTEVIFEILESNFDSEVGKIFTEYFRTGHLNPSVKSRAIRSCKEMAMRCLGRPATSGSDIIGKSFFTINSPTIWKAPNADGTLNSSNSFDLLTEENK